uniref:Lipase domain-containing protein n=1 Tax=Megaselia scalaris TaxID=36166 RepID=T1GV37_MEGSC
MDRPETLERSNFNVSYPTRIFSHGWLGGVHAPQTIEIVDSHLSNGRKENYNMIIVDWSCWAMTVNYYFARLRTRKAGKKTAELIDWLHEKTGMPFETTFVYGHSLGAHVAVYHGIQKRRILMIFWKNKEPKRSNLVIHNFTPGVYSSWFSV